MPLANEANLRAWLKKLEAREPQAKSRYGNFYAFLDQDVPGWTSIVKDQRFLVWGSARDQRTGSCVFDMMFDCWDDPTWKGERFGVFMRMFLREMEQARSSSKGFLGRLLGSKSEVQPMPAPRSVFAGRYEFINKLGEGGAGDVFLTWARDVQDLFALKILKPDLWKNNEALDGFKKEVETWTKLGSHPNVVEAHYLDIVHEVYCLTMEYVEGSRGVGPSLGDKIRWGNVSDTDVAKWFVQVVDGLEHAYAHGIRAHRDLKPANILVTRAGDAKVTDFGLASGMPAHNVLKTNDEKGRWSGTPAYMPPEQFADMEACSQQSDIYSLGASLYQVTSRGELPFTPRPPNNATARERARFLQELRAMHEHAVPSQLDTPFWPVIEKCLRKNPKDRFNDVAEFRAALGEAATGVKIAVPGKPIVEEDFWTYRTKAKTLMRLEQYEEAIEAFDAFLRILPDEDVMLDKAVCLFYLKRLWEAAQIYEHLLSKRSNVFGATWNAADCYRLLGQHDTAIEYASRAIEMKPQDWSCWLLLGNALYSRAVCTIKRGDEKAAHDDFVEAIAAHRHAVQLAPNNPATHHRLAMSRLEIEDFEGAKRSFERFLQLAGPDDPDRQSVEELLDIIKG